MRSPSLSSTTSPTWMPTRNSIRRSSGTPALRSISPLCTSIAQRTASTALRNSTIEPSPVRVRGLTKLLQWLRRRRQTERRAQADAEALIRDHGGEAYSEARQRERDVILPDGTTHAGRTPAHWRRVAPIVAKRTV